MREYLNALTIANNVRMHRTQFSGSYLILEGAKDGRIYPNHIDSSACHPVIALNKQNAIGALEILNEAQFLGVLAVVDTDFDKIVGRSYSVDSLILTDHHDLEVMLFNSPAFDRVLSEFGSEDKIRGFENHCGTDARTAILNCGSSIGALRLVSQQQELALDFNGLVYSNFVAEKTLVIDSAKLITAVKNNSGKHSLNDAELKNHVEVILSAGHDPLQLCVGHDLANIVALALRRAIGSNNATDVRVEMIEKLLRLSFDADSFRSTSLRGAICDWERNNSPFTVLQAGLC